MGCDRYRNDLETNPLNRSLLLRLSIFGEHTESYMDGN